MSEIQENEQTKGTEIIEAGHIFDVIVNEVALQFIKKENREVRT